MTAVRGRRLRSRMHFGDAVKLYRAGRIAESESLCRQALSIDHSDASICNLLGLIVQRRGDLAEAIDVLSRAVAASPNTPDFVRNLGLALGAAGEHGQAAARLEEAMRLQPDDPLTAKNLGVAYERLGRIDRAAAAYERAIALRPGDPNAQNALGNVLRKAGRTERAIECHKRALALDPRHAEAHHALAMALGEQGLVGEAIAFYRSAASLRPDSAAWHSDLLFALCHDPACTADSMREAACAWAIRFAERHTERAVPIFRERGVGRRLRVGYVSPDFRRHTIARLIAPVLAAHDRGGFEIHCYASVRKPDEETARLRSLSDAWHDIRDLSDEDAAELVRRHEIDILVDLAGHMGGNRLGILARRPAPVQVQLGYAATTGMSAMQYRVTDGFCDPPGRTESHGVEQLIRLPQCAWCYEPDPDAPPPGPLPAIQNRYVTFACLNRPMKISDAAIACYARILAELPTSKLILLGGLAGDGNASLRERFARRAITGCRLTLAPWQGRRGYLELMRQADVALDAFPYNGDTTTCDALWMGVPVLALAGDAFLSRRGVSHLSNVGLDDWIATDANDYVRRATSMAADLPLLQSLRAGLRGRLARSPLANGITYTRNLESAYRAIWARG